MLFKPPFLDPEIIFKTSRSGGKGGQHVNKVSTKVQAAFHVAGSALLTDEQKTVIREKLGDRLSSEGYLQTVSQVERTQAGNKAIAISKLYAMLNKCFIVRKKRKATKPGKGAVEKRLLTKKLQAERKSRRKKDF